MKLKIGYSTRLGKKQLLKGSCCLMIIMCAC